MKFVSWSFVLILLHVLGSRARELADLEYPNGNTNNLRLHSMEHIHAHPSSHIDPQLMVFFTMNDLKMGKKIPIYFPKKVLSTAAKFLAKQEADSIPFSLNDLPKVLQLFSFPSTSPQATAIEDALRQCEISPIKGETKLCATSLESMLDFARGIFGSDSDFDILATKYLTVTATISVPLQNYTIISEEPREISAAKMVACHILPYPYAVFYCHSQESESKVFEVHLEGENGGMVDAVAVCHMDTSQWSHQHASFRVLGIEPGFSHVCHFFPPDNLVFVPTSKPRQAMK